MSPDGPVGLTVAIDTEEDNWGSFSETGATTRNIAHLVELQERMAKWGARPTYLVNYAPLVATDSVKVLGRLAGTEGVEIGAHCHPWNTPPSTGEGPGRSMMRDLPEEANDAMIAEVTRRIASELGVAPRTFRAGRWGFGPTVARPLARHGYAIDVSVSPFIDWGPDGGPDYSDAPHRPYRFHPDRPLVPDPAGPLLEIPTTVGFVSGDHRSRDRLRRRIQRSPLGRLKAIGILDRLGVLRRRWLSPETASAQDMISLAAACLRTGEPLLGLTFHSCTLLPGVTPFVRDASDRERFMASIEAVLRWAAERSVRFRTLSEAGAAL